MIDTDDTIPNENVNELSLPKAAIYYSAFARVFPLQPNTKLPLLPGDWSEYASDDIGQVASWWTRYPNANIALVMDTRLTTIDIDVKDGKDGVKSFNELKTVKSTTGQKTPTGGLHLIYQHPTHQSTPYHNATNRGAYGGLDIRSGNAYIVVAPSRINNQPYEFIGALPNAPVLPPHLHDLLTSWQQTLVQIGLPQPSIINGPDRARLMDLADTYTGKPMVFYHAGDATHYRDDRSAALMAVATLLYSHNHTDQEVLTLLATNPYCTAVAFDRKKGDFAGQVAWLWKYTCQKARTNAPSNLVDQVFDQQPTNNQSNPTDTTTQSDQPINNQQSVMDEFTNLIDNIKSIADIETLDKALRLVAATRETLRVDAMMQQLKNSNTGFTFTAIKTRLNEIREAMRLQALSNHNAAPLVFPDINPETQQPRSTTRNFNALLRHYLIRLRYNEMNHHLDMDIPNSSWHMDNIHNDQRTYIRDLMVRHNMDISRTDEYISAVASTCSYHPVRTIIDSTTWDKTKRVQPFLDMIQGDPSAKGFTDTLIRTWLVSAVRVLHPYGDMPPRGVLVLAGPQSIGKTALFRKLAFPNTLKEGLHLDAANKDSIKQAVSSWLVELGELDATFRKSDIAALKAHISNTTDILRLPYAAKESSWQRRTVYGGTVNDTTFLQDQTGNTRFWTVEVNSIDLDGIDRLFAGNGREQFWAEVGEMLEAGHHYLLSKEQLEQLDRHNDLFREVPHEEELLEHRFDWDKPRTHPMTIGEIADVIGVNQQSKYGKSALTSALKRLTGRHLAPKGTRRDGVYGRYWMMPPKVMVRSTDAFDFLD